MLLLMVAFFVLCVCVLFFFWGGGGVKGKNPWSENPSARFGLHPLPFFRPPSGAARSVARSSPLLWSWGSVCRVEAAPCSYLIETRKVYRKLANFPPKPGVSARTSLSCFLRILGFPGFQAAFGVYANLGERGMNISNPFGFICPSCMCKGYVQAPLEFGDLSGLKIMSMGVFNWKIDGPGR